MKLDGWISEFGGKDSKGYFHRKSYYVHDENFVDNRRRYIRKLNNTDVYQCAYHYETTDYENCAIIGEPYLDFDIDDIEKNYKKLVRAVKYSINYIQNNMGIPAEELRIYFSGHKGFHVVIPGECIGIMPSQNLNEEFKYFAMGIAYLSCGKNASAIPQSAVDLGIYDRKRLFRLVNSVNSKSGLFKVPISIDQLYEYSYEEMKAWAKSPRLFRPQPPTFRSKAVTGYVEIVETGMEYESERDGVHKKHKKRNITLKEGERLPLLPCAQYLLEHGAIKGTRNHSCFALASSILQAGYTTEEVYDMIEEWNDRNEEPLAEREVEVTVSSAIAAFDSGKGVGCGKYKELDYCQSDCKLME